MPRKEVRQGLPSVQMGGKKVPGYDANVCLQILERVAAGETLEAICSDPDLPSRATFWRWCVAHPELNRAYNAARELSAQSFEDMALAMAKTLREPNDFTGTKVRAFEVAMAQYRWSAARRDPGRYGQQNTPTLIVPIQINTTLDLGSLAAGGNSTKEYPDIYEIEAKVDAPEGLMPAPEAVSDPLDVMPGKKGKFTPGKNADKDLSLGAETVDT